MENCAQSQDDLARENAFLLKRSQKTAELYALSPEESLKDITQAVFNHKNTCTEVKKAIAQAKRRYYLFTYPSDGLQIKGYLSLPTSIPTPLPLLILLRGGNRLFGLPHPGELSIQPHYACITTTYRGGVSEGEDEFGGNDVNDVKNLIEFLPALAEKFQLQFQAEKTFLIGVSRGAMQLFLALGRYPELQNKIKKAASICGLLNIALAIEQRADFRETMQKDFGLPCNERAKQWIAWRQPLNVVQKISTTLPILIAQGTNDHRVPLQAGYDMLKALQQMSHPWVTYWEFSGGNHVLTNVPTFPTQLIQWLELDPKTAP